MSAVAAAIKYDADAVMIDERTTRYLLERPDKLKNKLAHKLHLGIEVNKQVLSELRQKTKSIKFIRSVEFVTVAFENHLLDDYLPDRADSKETLLDALLWGLKINGCAISTADLEKLYKISLKTG